MSATTPDEAQEEVNRFCAMYRVVSLEKHLIADGDRSYWALCVSYLEATPSQSNSMRRSGRKEAVDYRAILDEPDCALCVRLRSLRKTLVGRESLQYLQRVPTPGMQATGNSLVRLFHCGSAGGLCWRCGRGFWGGQRGQSYAHARTDCLTSAIRITSPSLNKVFFLWVEFRCVL